MDFNSYKKCLRDWRVPIVFSVGLLSFTLITTYFYAANQKKYFQEKSEQIAAGIALDLRTVILNRISILNVLSKHSLNVRSNVFDETAEALVEAYPGFYSINRVNPAGRITKVVPLDSNRAALNQNLLQRDDVKEYLIEARDTTTPTMSHKLMTYQNIPAFTLYLPLYKNSHFRGWLNAVFDFDSWLTEYIKYKKLNHTRIIVNWNHPHSESIDSGDQEANPDFKFNHKILNQELEISIGFSSAHSDFVKSQYEIMMAGVGIILLILALALIAQLNRSKLVLHNINNSLALKNNLLSSLSHDLATPLTSLTIQLERLCRDKKEDLQSAKPQIHNVARLLSVMADMLKSVRLLHAQDIGILQIPTEAIALQPAIEDAITLVAAVAEKKNIGFNILPSLSHQRVCAHSGTLVNNVLLNTLTNAIKFSPINGTVNIHAERTEAETFLFIEDQGAGLNLAQLEKFKNLNFISSTLGTQQENGTGLGLLQIHGFMKAYGGSVQLENIQPKGCRITLIFKTA